MPPTRPIHLGDELASGSLRARVHPDLSLRDLVLGGARALDAVSFAVRDAVWATAGTEVERFEGATDDDGFEIDFRCRQHGPGVDIAWTGTYRGEHGALTAVIDGVALQDQDLNRAGFSVLHPLELKGRRVTLTTDGGVEHGRFGERIDPRVLFTGVRAMDCDLGGVVARIEFGGEPFETEDHRNWSDAGWKTYCTPLAMAAPRRYSRGDRIRQTVRLEARSRPRGSGAAGRTVGRRDEVTISIGEASNARLPALGSSAADLLHAPTGMLEQEATLGLAFLDVELEDGPDAPARLARASTEAVALGVPLRVALTTGTDAVSSWADRLEGVPATVESVSVFDPATSSSSSALVEAMRWALAGRGGGVSGAAVGGGTRGYFAELNRLGDPLAPAAFLQLALSPQVHHRDGDLVLDTVRAMPDVLHDAAGLAAGRPVRVGPITLRQRMNVHLRPPAPVPPAERMGEDVDPRQHTAFTAVWLVGVVAGLAGAESLSLFRTRGLRGILPADPATASAEQLLPAHVVRSVAAHAGDRVLAIDVDAPRRVVALGIRTADGAHRVWLANRTGDRLGCVVPAASGRSLRLAPLELVELSLVPGPTGTTVGMLRNGLPADL